MKCLLEVCLFALTTTSCIAAQSASCAYQPLQKGISVDLPVSSSAAPMPDADQEDSLIVSVTDDGSVYFGVNPISPEALAEKIKRGLPSRTDNKLYIKADARTLYASVLNVLDAVRTAGVEAPTLLTSQRNSSEPGTLVAPRGVEVLVGPPFPPGPEATVVQVLNSGQRWPTLKINDEHTARAVLQSTLKQLQNRSKRVVLVKAEGTLRYGDVVDVVDMCSSTGATVLLVTQKQ